MGWDGGEASEGRESLIMKLAFDVANNASLV